MWERVKGGEVAVKAVVFEEGFAACFVEFERSFLIVKQNKNVFPDAGVDRRFPSPGPKVKESGIDPGIGFFWDDDEITFNESVLGAVSRDAEDR